MWLLPSTRPWESAVLIFMEVIILFPLPLPLAVAESLFLRLSFKKKILQLASGHGYQALHKYSSIFQSAWSYQDVCSLLQGEEAVGSEKSLPAKSLRSLEVLTVVSAAMAGA